MASHHDLPTLSFPVGEPVSTLNQSFSSMIYNVTLPIGIFAPAMSRISDGKDNPAYIEYMRIFTMFVYIFNKKVLSTNQHSGCDAVTGMERFPVYFEYLVSDAIEVSDPAQFQTTLINCVGIRFYFIQNDTSGPSLTSALLNVIAEQGGTASSQDGGDEEGGAKKKKARPKPPGPPKKNSVGGNPNILYNFYANVENMKTWYSDCLTYMGKIDYGLAEFAENTQGDQLEPLTAHPMFPSTLFGFEKSCIPGTHPLQCRDVESIAFPRMVFKVPPVMLSPIAMLCVTLPLTVRWTKQTPANQEYTMRTFKHQTRMEHYFVHGYVKKNDLRDIRRLNQARIEDVSRQFSGDVLVREKKKVADETVRSIQDVWCETASVSDPIKSMSKWMANYDTWTCNSPMYLWDTKLSYFGNMMACEMWSLETNFGISTTHSILLRCLVSSLNAYRYKLSLHANVLMLGQGATGKSHILDTIAEILVPDTTKKVTHQTDEAAAVDSDQNDCINLLHEAPPGFLGQGDRNSDQSTGSHLIKDMMTSCMVTTDTMFVDSETGRRIKTKCSSECVGVYIIATNERADSIPEALSTRMSNVTVDTVDRPGYNVVDKADAPPNEKCEQGREEHILRWRMRQVMTNMVEKAIFTGCMKDVEMTIPRLMYNKLVLHMEKLGIVGSGATIRGKSFMMNFVRTMTIIHAVDKYANDPESPGYRKSMTFQNLVGIQPYLVASEELTFFCISLCADTLIDINNFRVIEMFTGAYGSGIQSTRGAPRAVDGSYVIKGYPENRALLYSQVVAHVTGNKTYKTKLSPENIKVAYNSIMKTTYRGQPVIIEGGDDGRTAYVNAAFVDNFFTWDTSLERFVANLDVFDQLVSSLKESYLHTNMPPLRRFVTGVTVDTQLPFAMETIDITPNNDKVMEWRNVAMSLQDDFDIVDNYTSTHIEDDVLKSYMGVDYVGPGANTLLYKHNMTGQVLSGDYPNNVVQWFVRKHGVKTTSKRHNTSDAHEAYSACKRRKKEHAQKK